MAYLYTTKHLLILTDAMPTVGNEPEKQTIEAVTKANDYGITTSIIGIQLDEKGTNLAKEIARAGKAKLLRFAYK